MTRTPCAHARTERADTSDWEYDRNPATGDYEPWRRHRYVVDVCVDCGNTVNRFGPIYDPPRW